MNMNYQAHEVFRVQKPKRPEGTNLEKKGLTFFKNFLCAAHYDGCYTYAISFNPHKVLHGTDEAG